MVDDCTSVGVRSNNNHHHHCDTEPHHHHQDSDQHHHSKQLVSICFGCGQGMCISINDNINVSEIFDRYILRVAPDLEWHAACLKCAECQQFLDESCKAFVRNGKTYCKLDYLRLFGEQCARCREYFGRNELVMKAPHRTYHVHCFTCIYCRQQLKPGDQFVLQDDELYCKNDCDLQHQYQHHRYLQPPPPFMRDFAPPPSASSLIDSDEWVVESALTSLDHPPMIGSNTTPPPSSMRSPHSDISSTTAAVPMIGSNSSSSSTGSSAKKPKKDKPKTTRIRTVLNEKQLMTLRACYNANARPDALMKEQLVEMTGLSARVIRVWFQNKRCKDKKRQIAMKQQQQSIEKDRALNGVRMHGVGPLIAHSPSAHHESSSLLAGALVDVQHYPQNHPALWTTTTSTIASSPSQHHHHQHMDAIGAAPFQQLMHSFGDMPTGGSGVTVSSGDIGSFMIPTGSTSYAPVSISSGVDDMDRFSPPMNAGASDLSSPSNSDYFAIIFDC